MRRQRVVMVLAGAAALWCAALLAVACTEPGGVARAAAGAAARVGSWRAAIEVPGTGALNKGGDAVVNSLSCGSAGNCAAVGHYTDGSGHQQAFVASETNGTWHAAIEVPGINDLDESGEARRVGEACSSGGNRSDGRKINDGDGHTQAFVAGEANGTWHAAIEVPGTATLNEGGSARVVAVSCPSVGNCTAGGFFDDGARQAQAFVASETNGTWHAAIDVPGINDIDGGFVQSLSCASAGNCAGRGG